MNHSLRSFIKRAFLVSVCVCCAAIPYRSGSGKSHSASDGDETKFWEIISIVALIIATGFSSWLQWLEHRHFRIFASNLRPKVLRSPPHFWPRLVIMSVLAVIALLRITLDHASSCTESSLDSDIGGIGVLVGIYVPILLLNVSLMLGFRQNSPTGAKETGAILLLNVAYLVFNLIKSFSNFNGLSFADRFVVLLVLDASSAALSMSLCDKECLAARTYVTLCTIFKILSYLAQIAALVTISWQWAGAEKCCYRQIWWTMLSSCNHLGASIWLYMALRIILDADSLWISHHYSSLYDGWKKNEDLGGANGKYDSLSSTVFSHYVHEIPLLLVNLVGLLVALRRQNIAHASRWSSWGQSAQLVTCLFGSIHWIFTNQQSFKQMMTKLSESVENGQGKQALHLCMQFLTWLANSAMLLWEVFQPRDIIILSAGRPSPTWSPITGLQASVRLGDINRVTQILDGGSSIDELQDQEGVRSVLCTAIECGQTAIAKILLERGATLYFGSSSEEVSGSALHSAAIVGDVDIARLLIDKDSRNLNTDDEYHRTTLIHALENSNKAFVAVLLDQGASPSKPTSPEIRPKALGTTPLELAVFRHELAITAMLYIYGANADSPMLETSANAGRDKGDGSCVRYLKALRVLRVPFSAYSMSVVVPDTERPDFDDFWNTYDYDEIYSATTKFRQVNLSSSSDFNALSMPLPFLEGKVNRELLDYYKKYRVSKRTLKAFQKKRRLGDDSMFKRYLPKLLPNVARRPSDTDIEIALNTARIHQKFFALDRETIDAEFDERE